MNEKLIKNGGIKHSNINCIIYNVNNQFGRREREFSLNIMIRGFNLFVCFFGSRSCFFSKYFASSQLKNNKRMAYDRLHRK